MIIYLLVPWVQEKKRSSLVLPNKNILLVLYPGTLEGMKQLSKFHFVLM